VLEEGGVKFIALRCAGFDKVGAAPAPLLAPSCCCQLLPIDWARRTAPVGAARLWHPHAFSDSLLDQES
jgi:hypothetical protein